jgi:hypothetical protein
MLAVALGAAHGRVEASPTRGAVGLMVLGDVPPEVVDDVECVLRFKLHLDVERLRAPADKPIEPDPRTGRVDALRLLRFVESAGRA